MNINLGKYSKAIVAFLAACGVLAAALSATDTEAVGHLTSSEVVQIVVAFLAVGGVYQIKNEK